MKKLLLLLVTFGFSFASSIVLEIKGSTIPKVDDLFEGFTGSYHFFIKDKYIYVSNFGKFTFNTENEEFDNGYISKLDINGKLIDQFFITDLDFPQGMTIVDDTIYVADRDTIRGFNLDSKKEVFSLTIERRPNFVGRYTTITIYDIVAKDEDTLLVSNEDYMLYEVHLKTREFNVFVDSRSIINDARNLFLDKDNLYLTGFLRELNVGMINLSTKKFTPIITKGGDYYGVAAKDNKLVVSNWGFGASKKDYEAGNNKTEYNNTDSLILIDLNTKKETIIDSLYIGGLVDMTFDQEGYLWILDTLKNRIIKVKI